MLLLATVVACGPANSAAPAGAAPLATLALPDLDPVDPVSGRLPVVATTSIIGDVVAQVGGEHIDLTTLMGPGQDPHSYKPAARDLSAAGGAAVIFVNGWNLEEGLEADLENIAGTALIVPISAGIVPLAIGADESDGGSADPHVWFAIANVIQWADNVATVLGEMDPAHAGDYTAHAAAYRAELNALADYTAAQLAQIPAGKRVLVTNHDSLNYFAQAYGFEILGTVLPGRSTNAEPAAGALADLITLMAENDVCTIFTETSVSDDLAQTVATELDGCDTVRVLPLYTGALGPAGSGADSYLGMFRANVDTIVQGLQ